MRPRRWQARAKDDLRFRRQGFREARVRERLLDVPAPIDFAATSNAYFSQAIVPMQAPAPPACGLQVEERYNRDLYPDKTKDPDFSAMYRSRLIYPAKELAPHEKATYEVGAYYGPKDRETLSTALGGQHGLQHLINLGMFTPVSKILVGFLIKAHSVIGNWGIAIIVLTICVRLVLFPLTWKQIKSMVAMRKLKPEMDEINGSSRTTRSRSRSPRWSCSARTESTRSAAVSRCWSRCRYGGRSTRCSRRRSSSTTRRFCGSPTSRRPTRTSSCRS